MSATFRAFLETVGQDLKFGWRTLRHSPGYATAAILILALGIGANTAMFSVIDGVLLKPLPFRQGEHLVLVQQSAPGSSVADAAVSIPELFDYRARLQTVRDLVEYHAMSFVLLNEGEPDRVDTAVVSANFFEMLGIKPAIGRTFVETDDDLGVEPVLLLSHEYWIEKFGGDKNVVGKIVQMNDHAHTIVGVLPAFPQYPRDNDVYMPTSACPFRAQSERNMAQSHRSFSALRVFGRLAGGATAVQASNEIRTIASGFDDAFPQDYRRAREFTGSAQPLQEQLVSNARPMLLAISGATMLVLLIACANVANLALARAVRRGRELALRTALGAGRGRLLRQLVTESVIVALAGGVIGVGLAWLSLDMLVTFIGRFTSRTQQIQIDGGVLLFALLASVVTGVIAGALPALSARRNLAQSMRDGGAQTGEGVGRRRLRAALVVAQVAVSFVLLVGAALLLESFYRLSSVQLGYDTRRVMTAAIFGNFSQTPEETFRIQTGVLEKLRTSPGVVAAAMTNTVPLSNIQPGTPPIVLEGGPANDSRSLVADPNVASQGYFEALGVPILAGRGLRDADSLDPNPVAVINQSMAKFWDGANPIGRRFAIDGGPQRNWITVVGVAADFRVYGADREIEAQYYTPFNRTNGFAGRVLARTDGNPNDLVQTIKAAVHTTNAQTPVEEIQTLEDLRTGRLAVPGVTAALLSIFAGVALVITVAGIAGLVGTSVSQRTREFGLRMALGASRGSVLRLVLRQGVVLVLIGLVAGIAGAYAFSQLITRFLFQTTSTDVSAYVVTSLLFIVAALAATIGPARRATSVDPLVALRSE